MREEPETRAGGGALSSARPARPRTRAPGAALPPRAPGRCPRDRRAAPHKVTALCAGCARAPGSDAPGYSRSHPCNLGPQGRRAALGSARSLETRTSGRGRVRGQWRRRALIGDICPRARPLCGPELPAPPRQPLAAGPDVMGAANSGRAAGGRVIRLVAGPRGGAAGAREGGKPPVKPNFWSKGKAAPLPLHIPLGASPLRSTSGPWEEGGGGGGLSSGRGVSPGDRVAGSHCGTGRAQHFHTALSLPQHSLLRLPPPPPAPADPSPPHPRVRLAGPFWGPPCVPPPKIPSPGSWVPGLFPPLPPRPTMPRTAGPPFLESLGGTPHKPGRGIPKTPPRRSWRGPGPAQPFPPSSPPLLPPPPSAPGL